MNNTWINGGRRDVDGNIKHENEILKELKITNKRDTIDEKLRCEFTHSN